MYAEGVRRHAIKEVLSLDISPNVAQRIWLRVSGVRSATHSLYLHLDALQGLI